MKNFRLTFLLALIPLMITSCKKAEPNLRAILNLQGPVEQCECIDSGAKISFNDTATTMTYDNLFGETAWLETIEHRRITLQVGEGETEHIVFFRYDKKGRLEEVADINKAANTKIITKYKYEKDELLPNFKSVKGGAEGKQEGAITYGTLDNFGNWTTATWNGTTYNRTLTYFAIPEGTEVTSNCPTDVSFDKEMFLQLIISLVIFAAFLVMSVHMLLVLFKGKLRADYGVIDFVEKRVAEGRTTKASEEENQQVIAIINEVYDQWQTVNVDGEEACIPYSGSVVRKSYAAIKEAVSIAPTSEEAINCINDFSAQLNAWMERSFNGSKLFIGISIAIAVLFSFLTENVSFGIFVGCGIVLYILASRKTTWQEIKDYKKGRNQKSFMSGLIGGLLGGVAAARTVRTVTKWDDGTTTVDDDHSETWIALVFLFIGCVILSVAIYFVAFINYLRNYVIYW